MKQRSAISHVIDKGREEMNKRVIKNKVLER